MKYLAISLGFLAGFGAAMFVPLTASAQTPASDRSGAKPVPNADARAQLVAVVRGGLEKGFSESNPQLLEAHLAADFQRRLIKGPTSMLVERRATFLAALPTFYRGQRLQYDIQSVRIADDNSSAAVIALSTYTSKYFGPRFIETLIFKKQGQQWKLTRQSLLPLHPSSPKKHAVHIFITQPYWSTDEYDTFGAYFAARAKQIGPSAVIDELEEKQLWPDAKPSHVVAVFREPPRVGSVVNFDLRIDGSRSEFFDLKYPVQELSSYFIAESYADGGHHRRKITANVELDEVSLGELAVDN